MMKKLMLTVALISGFSVAFAMETENKGECARVQQLRVRIARYEKNDCHLVKLGLGGLATTVSITTWGEPSPVTNTIAMATLLGTIACWFTSCLVERKARSLRRKLGDFDKE